MLLELFAAHGFGPDLLADGTFLSSHSMVFGRGNPCDIILQKAYAMTIRYRVLCSERLEVIALERNNALVAKQAQVRVEERLAAETQLRIEASATLETARLEINAAREARRSTELQLMTAAQRNAESLAAAEARIAVESEARSRERSRAEALADSDAERPRYQTQLYDLRCLVNDMRNSNSWRLTKPFRVAVLYARDKLKRGGRLA